MEKELLELKKLISEGKEFVALKLAEKKHLESIEMDLSSQVLKISDEIDIYNKVRVLLNQSADHGRKQAQTQIEMLVTRSLQYIFDDTHYFKIEFHERSNRVEAEFYVCSLFNGVEIKTKPEDSRGGGIVDVVALALRIALLETYRPKLNGPLILDEPGKHVSEEYIFKLSMFLKSITENFNRQVIMVTHNSHLMESADKGIRVELKDGISWINSSY